LSVALGAHAERVPTARSAERQAALGDGGYCSAPAGRVPMTTVRLTRADAKRSIQAVTFDRALTLSTYPASAGFSLALRSFLWIRRTL
jgi:hypothetical protein